MIRVVNVRGLNRPDQRAGIVYVGRRFAGWPGHALGNPFKPRPGFDALAAYRDWLLARPTLDADLAALWAETDKGAKSLGCWCVNWDGQVEPPMICHAVILACLLKERYEANATHTTSTPGGCSPAGGDAPG